MRNHQILPRAAALMLALCSSSFAQWQCSLNTVRGTWAFQGHGTAMMILPGASAPAPVPYASVGVMKVDNQGRYTAHATISVGGRVQDADLAGSLQVNADCTATQTCTGGTMQCADRLVVLDYGNEMRGMPTQSPLGPAAGLVSFRRMTWGDWGPQCTAGMVRGVYAGWREGTVIMPVPGQSQPVPLPFSGIVRFAVHSGGTVTAASTASMGGTIVEFEFPKASLLVNPDCTATLDYVAASKQFPGMTFPGVSKFIVLNFGNDLMGLDTHSSSGSPIVIENDRRISIMPMASDR